MKPLFCALALAAFTGAAAAGLRATAAPPATPDAANVACKIHQKSAITFPSRMLAEGVIRGEVQIVLEVDAQGQLADQLVTAYSHRPFADEVLRAVGQWRFEPGLADGKPVISVINLTINFEVAGIVVYERRDPPSHDDRSRDGKFAYEPHGKTTLDSPLAALHQPGPIYPLEWIEQGRTGTVLVDFYIDESGRARIPVAAAPADGFLAAVAVDAVKQWRFTPPKHQGQPVLARAQQIFVFKPKPKDLPSPSA